MKTKFISIDGWKYVLNACRHTVGKAPLEKEPSKKFKEDILIAEHGPIRELWVRWLWKGLKYWVSVHWVRHKWEKYVGTQRTDRTGIERDKLPQDAPVDFWGSANAQNLIDTARKRLCYQASKETRKCMEDLKWELGLSGEEELANVLVPNCVYRCGCPELDGCPFWDKFKEEFYHRNYDYSGLTDIRVRYDLYNELFVEKMEGNDDN